MILYASQHENSAISCKGDGKNIQKVMESQNHACTLHSITKKLLFVGARAELGEYAECGLTSQVYCVFLPFLVQKNVLAL